MTRTAAAIVLALALRVLAMSAQTTLTTGTPKEVGLSESILRAGVTLFQEAIDNDELRGAVLLVARSGKVVLHEALGWRNKEDNLLMQRDTLFRMASNTKPVVATAVLILADQEKLRLEDNVRRFVPSFDNYRSGNITVRHLLTHTSGFRIPTIFLSPLLERSTEHPDAPNLKLEVDRFGAIGADYTPGTTYSYSNPGYNTLGAIIEYVSKASLEDFLRRNIYDPLGMVDTSNHEIDSKLERMATVYRRRQGQWRQGWKPGDSPDYPFVRASGGMISTAWDYAKFCQMFLNRGIYDGHRVLNEETVKSATSPQTQFLYSADDPPEEETFYGLGWSVSGEGVYSHGGSDGTFAWVDPRHEIIGLVFTQSPGGRNPRNQFRRTVEAAIYERPRSGS